MMPEIILMILILAALVAYAVLGGADFGAGVWEFHTALRSPDKPPRYLRLVLYQYEFTDRQGRRDTGNWWKRERVGVVARRSRQ